MRTLRYAFRALARTPALAAVVVLSLALGIGANAALFSLVRQVLLRPLPVRAPGELVNLASPGPKDGGTWTSTAGDGDHTFSYPMFRDLARAAPRAGLAGLAAHRAVEVNLAYGGRTADGHGVLVSGSYFPLLGLTPALGRLLGPADDGPPGANPVAVLSHAYWTARLGADPGVVGRALVVNGRALTVVGVAPRGFAGTTRGEPAAVFAPIAMRDALVAGRPELEHRRRYWAYLFGRLRPGVTREAAERHLGAAYRQILTGVEVPAQVERSPRYLAEFAARRLELAPGARGQSLVFARTRGPLTLLFATAGVVLLIACANIANVLLARGAGRAGEMAVRLSLGAGRRRLVRQLLAEAGVLAAAGGALGLVVARGTLAGVAALAPAAVRETFTPALDWPAAAFATAAAAAVALAVGTFPALESTRPDLIARVRAGAGQVVGGARAASRVRTGLAGAQVALSMLLLVTAALFLRSLANLGRADLGLPIERTITFTLSPERSGYAPARAQALFARAADALAAVPGVAGVAVAQVPMLADDNAGDDVAVEGYQIGPAENTQVNTNRVGAGYFRALGVPLLAGREFADADRPGAPKVAVVNQAFARRFNLGPDPVGRRMATAVGGPLDVEIVGLVRDARYSAVRDTVPPVFFTPYAQAEGAGAATFYVRTALAPEPLLRAARGVVGRLDPALPVEQLRTLRAQVRENTALDRLLGTLAGAFAGLATLLAAVGLYGVLAYTVAQRTREIGVRMALGAGPGRVRALVLGQVGRLVLVGGAAGLVAALGVGRAARSLLFGVAGHDPAAIAAAGAVLALVGLAACYVPARRAARVEPTRALRYE